MEIVSVEKKDLPQIASLLAGGHNRPNDTEASGASYFEWKWFLSPSGKGVSFLGREKDEIVGVLATIQREIFFKNRKLLSWELTDGYVKPSRRGRGIHSALVEKILEEADERSVDFVYGAPNILSRPIYKKSSFLTIRRMPIKHLTRLRNPLHIKKNSEVREGNDEKISVREIENFGPEADKFFSALASSYDFAICREREYLEWRFLKNPSVRYRILGAFSSENILQGYIVFRVKRRGIFRMGYLVDFADIRPERPVAFEVLLKSALSRLKRENVSAVSCWTPRVSPFAEILKRRWFLPRKNAPVFLFRLARQGEKISSEEFFFDRNQKWHFTMSDTDNL